MACYNAVTQIIPAAAQHDPETPFVVHVYIKVAVTSRGEDWRKETWSCSSRGADVTCRHGSASVIFTIRQ